LPGGQLELGSVEVVLPDRAPDLTDARVLARFEDIELLSAETPVTSVSPGDAIPVDLRWRSRADGPLGAHVVVLQLLTADDGVVAGLERQPVDGRYPTSMWPPGYAVRDQHDLRVPETVPPGEYRLVLGVDRASDGHRVRMRRGALGLRSAQYMVVQQVQITD
jgi:hypothetical protein